MPADHVEKVKEQQAEDIATGLGEHIGHQPPDLTLEDLFLIKAQCRIQDRATVHHAHDHDQGVAQGNIKHQIGNALIPVAEAKAFETLPKVAQ